MPSATAVWPFEASDRDECLLDSTRRRAARSGVERRRRAGPAEPRPRLKVARIIARLNVGGPARHCVLLSEGLRRRGFDTVLLTGRLEPGEAGVLADDAASTPAGVPIRRVPGLRQPVSPRDDARALAELVRLLRAERPDVVHTHTSKAGALGRVAAALAGVPVVVHTFHGHVLEGYFPRLPSALVRLAERALGRLTTRIVTLSPGLKEDLSARFGVADAGRFEVIPLGRDLAPFRAGPRGLLRRELGLSPDAPLVGAVGRLVPIKDVPLLVRAFARVVERRPGATLVLVGDGPERAAIEAAAAARGLERRVRLLGWRDDLPAIYADLDLLAVSSRNEGTPLAMIEAFAAGVPVVATRVGGVADMFDAPGPDLAALATNGATPPPGVDLRAQGALVAPRDEVGLARAIDLLLGHPDLRRVAAAAAQARSEVYAAERLLDATEGLYRRLLVEAR
ncbi:MAG: glycosyltransferase [Planctomycetes bacterium]|nr:glycosyltransferase [Planctomycetota bacterium]